MTFFKKTTKKNAANKQIVTDARMLSTAELNAVAGGINSQPLPPGRRITL